MLDEKIQEAYKASLGVISEGCGEEEAKALENVLFEWGFFEAPASSMHHLAYEGGLLEHSLNVADTLTALDDARKDLDSSYAPAGPLVCTLIGLLHDLCKVDSYERRPDGKGWRWKFHTMQDFANKSEHGALSARRAMHVLSISGIYDHLTGEQIERIRAAITWHMGRYHEDISTVLNDPSMVSIEYARRACLTNELMQQAEEADPLVKLTHVADMYATHVLEGGR